MNKIDKLPPFKRFCVTIGNLPSSYVDSMSYYECLMWLCKYLKDTVIPAVNENAEAVNELINWFNNLDVQDEVDNKLDEMAESGELEAIIGAYINTNAILGFNTVADLKSAENLINGSYVRTLGYHTIGDLGGSTYKVRTVTNEDVVDEAEIIALNDESLIAELVKENEARPEQYGAYGDNEHDDTEALQLCINKNKFVRLGTKKYYKISDTLTIPQSFMMKGAGQYSRIESYIDTENKPIFYCETSIQHFHFAEFYIDARDTLAVGFEFKNRHCWLT